MDKIMTRTGAVRRVCGALVILLLTGPLVAGQSLTPDSWGFIVAQPEDLEPAEGSRAVAILGSTREPGPYVVRITFGPGQGTRPHFHDQDRYITVIKGTWWVALGPDSETYDPDSMIPRKAGSFLYEPANGYHYDTARDEEVVVQIPGIGPVMTTRLEPEPR